MSSTVGWRGYDRNRNCTYSKGHLFNPDTDKTACGLSLPTEGYGGYYVLDLDYGVEVTCQKCTDIGLSRHFKRVKENQRLADNDTLERTIDDLYDKRQLLDWMYIDVSEFGVLKDRLGWSGQKLSVVLRRIYYKKTGDDYVYTEGD